jgi:hypothetical protein
MHRRQWRSLDPRRQVPEIDYGTTWTDPQHPALHRALTWNPGLGELYSFISDSGDDVEVHSGYPTRERVDDALAGWAQRVEEPDGLTWLRRRVAATQPFRLQLADQTRDRLTDDAVASPVTANAERC